ncbi:MIP family channel protein [Enterococcus asini ATCC 700915]|uniref:MIP family channel protein n=1 Tax=Enterococcus asini ATCC 700915 TaxID=1158606 RepID=R2S5X2_9ENTE|nr:MIP/aquaporin family protein [Enterococcus asini]EOH88301.1 MIP family channel protein [Enterococcus asini ATCC 700915]EOT56098.1 glycerol uptake facilitator protein [Enterococcus asini ATCC 700915]MCD5028474.1 aquaporin family protein [Enterococcus asini]MDT2763195.1 aquaporin family protein [Enterococcus asini]OJG13304.1 MIP family channel protein [Enterococcus asini]
MDTSTTTQVIGEIIGTLILVLLGDGVVAGVSLRKSKAEGAGWVAITLGWGAGVTIGAYAAGYMSFAHLNPAVTIGMAIAGNIGWNMVVPYILGQMIGAILGAILLYIHYYPHWKETEDPAAILGTFATGPAIRSLGANLISEIIGTFMLVFALLAFGMNKFGEGLNPIAVGILILVIGLSLGGTTGYAINPARDLGPRLAHAFLPIPNKGDSDWGYAWVPVLGPIIGGSLAALLFMALPI